MFKVKKTYQNLTLSDKLSFDIDIEESSEHKIEEFLLMLYFIVTNFFNDMEFYKSTNHIPVNVEVIVFWGFESISKIIKIHVAESNFCFFLFFLTRQTHFQIFIKTIDPYIIFWFICYLHSFCFLRSKVFLH